MLQLTGGISPSLALHQIKQYPMISNDDSDNNNNNDDNNKNNNNYHDVSSDKYKFQNEAV